MFTCVLSGAAPSGVHPIALHRIICIGTPGTSMVYNDGRSVAVQNAGGWLSNAVDNRNESGRSDDGRPSPSDLVLRRETPPAKRLPGGDRRIESHTFRADSCRRVRRFRFRSFL